MKYLLISALAFILLGFLIIRNNYKFEDPALNINLFNDLYANDFNDAFAEYWYNGKAELSGFELTQARYGEIRKGKAALIFVTEPFSKSDQVKLDFPEKAGKDKISVLKLNATRNFQTGIYPYHMMTSTFNPVNQSVRKPAVKLNLTGQEWCGQVFQQLNLNGNEYDIHSFSYFQSEGDEKFSVDQTLVEDELMNIIRLNPDLLPEGNIQMIPSLMVSRFLHETVTPYAAMASKGTTTFNNLPVRYYNIEYPHNERILTIYFRENFPFLIEGWDDSYPVGEGSALTSTATRLNTLHLAYWEMNANIHESNYELLFTKN